MGPGAEVDSTECDDDEATEDAGRVDAGNTEPKDDDVDFLANGLDPAR